MGICSSKSLQKSRVSPTILQIQVQVECFGKHFVSELTEIHEIHFFKLKLGEINFPSLTLPSREINVLNDLFRIGYLLKFSVFPDTEFLNAWCIYHICPLNHTLSVSV